MDVFSIGGVERLCVDYGHALKDCGHECVIIPMRLSSLGDRIDCDFLIEDYDFTVSADQELRRIIASFDQATSEGTCTSRSRLQSQNQQADSRGKKMTF